MADWVVFFFGTLVGAGVCWVSIYLGTESDKKEEPAS
jgi:hypothetical protein